MTNTPLQDLFKGIHSDRWIGALRAVPADIAVTLPDHQLEALVRSIDAYTAAQVDRAISEQSA
jgi:hypothetical protein